MRSRKGSIHTRSLHKTRAFPKWSSKFAIQAYHSNLLETNSHYRLRKISHYQTIKMSEAAATPAAAAPAKVKKAAKPKKPAAHPSYGEMITKAIVGLADKKGSSKVAIKKYILSN